MVTASLAGAHFLRNNDDNKVSRLANLLQVLFEHYTSHSSSTANDLIRMLRTLVGLGFTTCLTDHVYTVCYQPYLHCFIQHDRGNFQKHCVALVLLSQTVANMVALAMDSFYIRCGPIYYPCFLNTLKNILDDVIITEANQHDEAKEVLGLLQHK